MTRRVLASARMGHVVISISELRNARVLKSIFEQIDTEIADEVDRWLWADAGLEAELPCDVEWPSSESAA